MQFYLHARYNRHVIHDDVVHVVYSSCISYCAVVFFLGKKVFMLLGDRLLVIDKMAGG